MPNEGYPTKQDLKQLDSFEGTVQEFLAYLQSIVNYSDSSVRWHVRGGILYAQFHTYGWSGNEEIQCHLEKTWFWMFCWDHSYRGGHHWFKIKLSSIGKLTEWGRIGRRKREDKQDKY